VEKVKGGRNEEMKVKEKRGSRKMDRE